MFEMMPLARAMMTPFYDIDRMSRSFFGDAPVRAFRTDIRETETGYVLEAELPGCKKEDISIDLNGDQLTIQAKCQSETEEQKENYLRRERFSGAYSRSFDVSEIDADAITARYEDGVLKLDLPRKAVVTPAARRLEIQ